MPKFAVGDRVEFTLASYSIPKGAMATVFQLHPHHQGPCVHFDDPKWEKKQSARSGWDESSFRRVDETHTFIPEDWS